MRRHSFTRRLISAAVVAAMMVPALASVIEAAVGTWLAPPPGQSITARNVEVSVGYNTQSSLNVTKIELWIDGRFYAGKTLVQPESRGVSSFWWDTSKFTRGVHRLAVKIIAGADVIATVTGTGTIGVTTYDLRVPSVRFANINSGDVLKGVSNIRMAVSDDGGEPPIVTLLVDNILKYLTNRQPYTYSLDTAKYPDGSHELQTYAYDSSGNKSDPAVVKVAFKNGLENPVVAAIAVDHNPKQTAASEDDGVGKLLTPTVEQPAARSSAPARAPEPAVKLSAPSIPAAPIARPVMAAPKPVRVAPAVSPRPAPAAAIAKPAAPPAPAQRVVASAPAAPVAHTITKPAVATTPKATAIAVQLEIKPSRQSPTPKSVATPAEPRIALAKSAVVAAEPKLQAPVKRVAPAVTAKPRAIASSAPSGSIRPATPNLARGLSGIAQPRTVDPPRESSVRGVRVSALPSGKAVRTNSRPIAGRAAEPRATVAPKASAATTVSVVAAPAFRTARIAPPAPSADAALPRILSRPEASGTKAVSATHASGSVRTSEASPRIASGKPQPPAAALDQARAAAPKPVRVAMLPTLRAGSNAASAESTIACPPPIRKDTRAKLEKRTILAKGKMKIRDLFHELGGIVFWDSATHTVTAYAHSIKLELTIGSRVMKVNGADVQVQVMPTLINGRTIIDAALYQRICELIESAPESASINVK